MLRRALLVLWLTFAGSFHLLANEHASEIMLNDAKQCSFVQSRAQRLDCFDNIFLLPALNQREKPEKSGVDRKTEESVDISLIRPEPWQRAVKSESNRQQELGWIRNDVLDNHGNLALWYTVSTLRPTESNAFSAILMASCINSISRLEIFFPVPLNGLRADISFGGERQRWIFDEQGVVLRSGRGSAAISILRPMHREKQIVVRSNNESINGLTFEIPNSSEVISELRGLCRW